MSVFSGHLIFIDERPGSGILNAFFEHDDLAYYVIENDHYDLSGYLYRHRRKSHLCYENKYYELFHAERDQPAGEK